MWDESRPTPDVARVQRVHRQKKGTNPCPFCVRSERRSATPIGGPDQRLRLDRDRARLRLLLFLDRVPLLLDRLLLFRARLPLERFRVEPLPARRFRVAAAFRAEADRADLLRWAEARPPRRPPFFAGPLLVLRPRPEPDLRPPPDIAFSVAQARRSASSSGTPRLS